MKNQEKRAKEWADMSLAEQLNSEFPPRIIRELPRYDFSSLDAAQGLEHSYFIWGITGSGKTLYSAALVREILRRNYLKGRCLTARFITFDDVLLQIRRTYNRQEGLSEGEIIDRYRQVDYLVLDDFGIHKQTDWTYQVLYSIINHRYEHLKPIIITSNYSLEDLAVKLEDDRIVSRLASMCEVIHIKKPKRRTYGEC